MKPAYAVLNLAKTAFDEQSGLRFVIDGTQQREAGLYSFYVYSDKAAAERKAKEFATITSVGVIFEMTEAFIIKPTPIEVITVRRCDCHEQEQCSDCGS